MEHDKMTFLMIPEDLVQEIREGLKILKELGGRGKSDDMLTDYITEEDAKKQIGRKTTWFWQKRKDGLPFTRVGSKIFYKKADIVSLMKNEKQR